MKNLVGNKYIIWGTGDNGKAIGILLTELGYELIAYIDNNSNRWNSLIEGVKIYPPSQLNDIIEFGADVIIIGVHDKRVSDEIEKMINTLTASSDKDVEVLDCNTTKNMIHTQYMEKMKENLSYRWDVDFMSYSMDWLDNIDSEVKYWLEVCAKETGAAHDDYVNRVNNNRFARGDSDVQEFSNKLKDGDVVVDLGCGLYTMYGSLLDNGNKVKVIQMDPLAHFYNIINRKYAPRRFERYDFCRFGMFEFVDSFLPEKSVDCIMINNALDHCVEPYRSIIKCLHVLKKGGILRLVHRRAEAVFEGWQGLHKWNVDYNEADELILWNRTNAVNVTKELNGVVEITLTHSPEGTLPENTYVTAEICKIDDNNKGYDCYKKDRDELAYLLDRIMYKYSKIVMDAEL